MRYSIGIDLGTTNCALSYAPLEGPDKGSTVYPIGQRDSAGTRAAHPTLPSFLHRPLESEMVGEERDGWVVGAYARKLAADRPGTVAHSAKSWLAHHGVDRTQGILPWGSSEMPEGQKLSPIRASSLLLRHLQDEWNATFAGQGADFADQEITITVPASFDAVAQKLTLEAATMAGFPPGVRFLEEPQAAFYRWLEAHPAEGALTEKLPMLATAPQHIVVVDIGGGTSDFSLFEIARAEGGKAPGIKRVAVSDHILLGGDNVDLALAHLVEPRLVGEGESLSAKQWSYLVASCRDLKERILSEQDEGVEQFPVTVPATGSGLMAGSLSAELGREEVLGLLLEGFFPRCGAEARPSQGRTGLRELGLPYAADSAVTRYLAEFLHGRPKVDAVLCNGGMLTPARLRSHLVALMAEWQEGAAPVVLENPEPDLAVARGAAHYGVLCHRPERARIEAGAARSVYLEVGAAGGGERSLVCILPRGTEPGEELLIEKPALRLQLDTRVEFKAWYSTRRSRDRVGAVVSLEEEGFHALPPLRTTARLAPGEAGPADGQLPVHLRTSLSAVGMMQVECVRAEGGQSWPLEFDLLAVQQQADAEAREKKKGGLRKLVRINFGKGGTAAAVAERNEEVASTPSPVGAGEEEVVSDPGIEAEVLAEAHTHLKTVLQNPGSRQAPVTPARLLKRLQEILGLPKQDWNGALVRALWETLEECYEARALSMDHESTWLGMAGFLLRPGYGAPGDAARIDQLWRLQEDGLAFPKKGMKILSHVLWRRVSGGLDRTRQTELLESAWAQLREAKSPPAELILMAGALERLEAGRKQELVGLFLERGVAAAKAGGHAGPYFMALTSLLSRTPLYGGPENVLPPEWVESAFEATRDLDWASESASELQILFLRAARLTGDRQLDVPKALGKQIGSKLSKAKVAGVKLAALQEVIPIASADRAQLFGESLPLGISLG